MRTNGCFFVIQIQWEKNIHYVMRVRLFQSQRGRSDDKMINEIENWFFISFLNYHVWAKNHWIFSTYHFSLIIFLPSSLHLRVGKFHPFDMMDILVPLNWKKNLHRESSGCTRTSASPCPLNSRSVYIYNRQHTYPLGYYLFLIFPSIVFFLINSDLHNGYNKLKIQFSFSINQLEWELNLFYEWLAYH